MAAWKACRGGDDASQREVFAFCWDTLTISQGLGTLSTRPSWWPPRAQLLRGTSGSSMWLYHGQLSSQCSLETLLPPAGLALSCQIVWPRRKRWGGSVGPALGSALSRLLTRRGS
eukprot:11209446-Lingulodinium_polyedra.AAC.1